MTKDKAKQIRSLCSAACQDHVPGESCTCRQAISVGVCVQDEFSQWSFILFLILTAFGQNHMVQIMLFFV